MENEFSFSKQYGKMFADAKAIKNLDRMEEIFNELASEVGLPNETADLSSAESGKRLAELLNARQSGASFEGSVPGKKI